MAFPADFPSCLQHFSTTAERLRAADDALAGQDPAELSAAQLDWLSTEFGRALAAAEAPAEVVSAHANVVAAVLTNARTQLADADSFWDVAAAQLQIDGEALEAVREAASAAGADTEPLELPVVPYAEFRPWLELDPEAGRLSLVLPDPSSAWSVDAGFDTFRISPQPQPPELRDAPSRVALVQPTARITATHAASGTKHRLGVVAEDFPVLFFGPDCRPLPDQHRITAPSVFVLAPTRTKFSAEGAAVEVADELRFTTWPEWSLFELRDLAAADVETLTVALDHPASFTTRQVRVSAPEDPHSRLPEWHSADNAIPDLRGTDAGRIYGSSPRLVLPVDPAPEWSVELYYVDPLGERELVEQLVELAEFQGQELALFADAYEDAWVGRYEVDVMRDETLVGRRTFNMAEGFDLHVTYNGAQFRHPDQAADANAYTKAYYSQRKGAEKYIDVPFDKTQSVPRGAETAMFQISNAVDYCLDVVVVPKALKYSLDLRGEQPDWDTHPGTIPQGSLARNGELKVRFPVAIGGSAALLLTHEVSRKVRVIQLKRRRHGRVFTVGNSAIQHAFPEAHANLVATLAWHPASAAQTWAELSDSFGSELEFEKAWEAHATPDVQLATLLRLNESEFELSGRIVGDSLRLSGNAMGRQLTGFLWPVTRPDIAPWRVEFSAQLSTRVPEELQEAGPLAVDVVEAQPGYQAKAPNRPSMRAFIVAQDGYFDDGHGDELAYKLSGANPRATVAKHEQPALWRHLFALRNLGPSATRPMAGVLRKTIDADPRHMLEALGRSNVRSGDQPALAIAHGLANYDFHSNGERVAEFRALPWIRVVEQLNDLVDGHADWDDATDFIRTAGGEVLLELLRGGEDTGTADTQQVMKEVLTAAKANNTQQALEALYDVAPARRVADASALRHGWAEILRRRKKFIDVTGFAEFREEMMKQEANVVGDEIRAHLHLLRRFAHTAGKRQKNQWAWVPYLSAMAAHITRAGAAELKGRVSYYVPLKPEHLTTWAELAQLAPTLTIYDVVREEARQLVRANGPVERL
ncbi:hypothetical protein [Corynebacterium confusum]|uniref:hypothetical protein n=1 Tax=Corynebacterium confusum TaxID=71254 RepID=UPI0025B319FA|nr:hypothetical protein [Corynebacterium confusum]WJY89891.1 hypothetical protein CCONF_06845 [Corynebacterium confusum]